MKLSSLTLLQSCRIFVDTVLVQPNLDPAVVDAGKELYLDLINEIQKTLYAMEEQNRKGSA
jgi:hypothetical protein